MDAPITLLIVLFLMLFAMVLIVVGVGLRYLEAQRKRKVGAFLQSASGESRMAPANLLDDQNNDSLLSGLEVLYQLPVLKGLRAKLQQAGMGWSPGTVILLMALGAAAGVFLGFRLRVPVFREFAMIGFACVLGLLPYVFVLWKRNKRLAAFEEQFPEALDFMARSMRAGHAFSVSLEMMADESPEPLGLEFRQVFNEQNLGAPIETALKNLALRVPLLDVRFFVSAVLLQREAGGNLAEILTKLGYIIRERFRLKGQVKAVSAHGRITALILCVMPVIVSILLMIVAPEYLTLLAEDPDGKYLIVGAIMGQIAGYFWMKKIIKIKV